MAVVPKHTDSHSRYDPKQELTADQLHRFGKVAQKARERRKEEVERGTMSAVARAAKDTAFKPIVTPKREKRNTVRYAAWMLVAMAVSLWLMYMSR
ncbi:hypothetical protein L1D13_17935 [Vibrio tubiashii]|uniref:hypothetical protein n=1 Tax=Vibrio tubiashii TaxID=29498 RepID=UPI001EFE9313|nr:hypothetical protein [Vibrio tubiashii]MCG9580316.1 hypothetical protein [Vibrio tubiashii]MCG9613907.1 hypothetical protein [Vibrio tubiashii]MCG9688787.1 hypothetical protein [Vibrio tubiashii]